MRRCYDCPAFCQQGPRLTREQMLRQEAAHVFAELLGPDLVEKNLQAIQQGHDLCHIG